MDVVRRSYERTKFVTSERSSLIFEKLKLVEGAKWSFHRSNHFVPVPSAPSRVFPSPSRGYIPLSHFGNPEKTEEERREKKKKVGQNRGEEKKNETRAATSPPPLPIILSPSPDLRFPHHHLRWKASTATYTADGATRQRSGARRHKGGGPG